MSDLSSSALTCVSTITPTCSNLTSTSTAAAATTPTSTSTNHDTAIQLQFYNQFNPLIQQLRTHVLEIHPQPHPHPHSHPHPPLHHHYMARKEKEEDVDAPIYLAAGN